MDRCDILLILSIKASNDFIRINFYILIFHIASEKVFNYA